MLYRLWCRLELPRTRPYTFPFTLKSLPFFHHRSSQNMALIENFEVSPLTEKSRFVVPFRIHYKKNGVNRIWDGIKAHNSVSVLIYNRDRKSFVFVRQFRPVVYYALLRKAEGEGVSEIAKEPHTPIGPDGKPIDLPSFLGETIELCAGIVDKNCSLEETASTEVFEECGYRIEPSRLRKITTGSSSSGLSGTTSTVFYAEVGDADLVPNAGGGNPEEGEVIEVIYWPQDKADDLLHLMDDVEGKEKTFVSAIALLAVLWWQKNVLPCLKL